MESTYLAASHLIVCAGFALAGFHSRRDGVRLAACTTQAVASLGMALAALFENPSMWGVASAVQVGGSLLIALALINRRKD